MGSSVRTGQRGSAAVLLILMQNLICPNCGSPLRASHGSLYAVCPFCHSQTLITELINASSSNEKREGTDFVIQGATLVKYTGISQIPVIPFGVRKIEKEAFRHTSILSIVIPEGVTEIGQYAFDDCDELTTISLPHSLKKIGNRAFRRCFSLTSVNFDGRWADIDQGEDIFIGCPCNPGTIERRSYDSEDEIIEQARKRAGVCTYCGGSFRFLKKVCSKCGRPKNY